MGELREATAGMNQEQKSNLANTVAGMEVKLFEGIESDPSVDTVMKGAKVMEEYGPDWIVAIGDSYRYFYDSSKSASQIIRQNVTINALKEGIRAAAEPSHIFLQIMA